jgi:hypothetical protein
LAKLNLNFYHRTENVGENVDDPFH